MPINAKFLAALNDINKLRAQTEGRDAALDALIKAKSNNTEGVAAITAHQLFWNGIEADLVPLVPKDADWSKDSWGVLKQKAAEQRIVLGLDNANIEVLVAILTHNTDACRAYIASQKMLPLDIKVIDASAHDVAKKYAKEDWKKLTGVLTSDVLGAIRIAATQQLLVLAEEKLEQINDSGQLSHLKTLVDANDIKSVIHTLFDINVTAELPNTLLAAFKEALERKTAVAVTALSTGKINGAEHPEILNVLNSLQQEEIDSSTDPSQPLIENLLSSEEYEDSKEIDNINSAEIVFENSIVDTFSTTGIDDYKKIHNAALAQLIANNTTLTVTKEGVASINNALYPKKENAKPDFNSHAGYKKFIDAISPALTNRDSQPPYSLFGLSADGLVLEDNQVLEAIKKQYEFNVGIMKVNDKYNKEKSNISYTELFNLFLSVEKNKSLVANDSSFSDADSDLKRYFTLIKNGSGLADFLSKCPATSKEEQQLKKELASRLTDYLFNNLQKEIRSAPLLKGHDKVRIALKEIDEELKQLAKSYEPLIESLSALDYLFDVKPEQLTGPTFQAKARVHKEELRAKYAALSEQCGTVVQQLLHDFEQLNLHTQSIPFATQVAKINPLDKKLGHDNLEKIKAYRELLPVEIDKINTALNQYRKLQEKTTEIINVLDHAAEDGVYRMVRDGVTCRAVSSEQLKKLPHQAQGASIPSVFGECHGTSEKKNWQLLKTSEHESAFIFDTEYNNPAKQVQIRGRFSQTYHHDVLAAPLSIKEGEVKPSVCRIEAVNMPQFTKPLTGGDAAEMDHARVKYFLEMAAALLAANHGKAPTKGNPIRLYGSNANDIKFLWTALVLLGEGQPAFGKEAISVRASCFDPKNEEGRLFGYSNSSLYNTVFKKYKEDVVAMQKVSQQALADDGHDKAIKVMDQFKSGLQWAKNDSETMDKSVGNNGTAPEPESAPQSRGMHKQ